MRGDASVDVLNLKYGALAFAPVCEQLLIQALFCQRYSGYGYRVTAGFYVWFMFRFRIRVRYGVLFKIEVTKSMSVGRCEGRSCCRSKIMS